MYLSNNKIKDWTEIERLSVLANLSDLLLIGNPIYTDFKENIPDYRIEVCYLILHILVKSIVLFLLIGAQTTTSTEEIGWDTSRHRRKRLSGTTSQQHLKNTIFHFFYNQHYFHSHNVRKQRRRDVTAESTGLRTGHLLSCFDVEMDHGIGVHSGLHCSTNE